MAAQAGAKFAVSPGFSSKLLTAASVPLLPGVATAGETMAAAEAGCTFLKLFPAQAVGGVEMLKALQGPFPELRFCPTGGVTAELAPTYLRLPNVICVGGSWMATSAMIAERDWMAIEAEAKRAAAFFRAGAPASEV